MACPRNGVEFGLKPRVHGANHSDAKRLCESLQRRAWQRQARRMRCEGYGWAVVAPGQSGGLADWVGLASSVPGETPNR